MLFKPLNSIKHLLLKQTQENVPEIFVRSFSKWRLLFQEFQSFNLQGRQYSITPQRALCILPCNDGHAGCKRELLSIGKRWFRTSPGAQPFCSDSRNFPCSKSWCWELWKYYSDSMIVPKIVTYTILPHSLPSVVKSVLTALSPTLQGDGSKYRINKH